MSRYSVAAAIVLTLAGSPATARQEPLTEDAAVRRALAVSATVAAAEADLAAAAARLDAADAARRPLVAASATASRLSSVPEFKAPLAGPGQPPVTIFPDIRNQFSLAVSLSQALYTGGAVTAERQAAAREKGAARAAVQSARATVSLETSVTYWSTVAASKRRQAATARGDRAQRLVDDVDALVRAGLATRTDLLSAQAQLAAAKLALVHAEADLQDATAALASLLQVDPAAARPTPEPPDGLPQRPASVGELQSEARATQPELDVAAQRVAALEARQATALAAGRPTVAASVQVDESRPNHRYLPLADEWNDTWSVGISAGWTLWDGGRTRARVATSRSLYRAAVARLDELQRRIDLRVVQARQSLLSALATVTAATASLRAASAREAAVRDSYDEGMASISDVLAAQAELAAAESELATSRAGAWIAKARLDEVLGR